MTERQEPYDGRLSRTDLWEPGGEIPPGDPTDRSIEHILELLAA
jgi:hypothetical protein